MRKLKSLPVKRCLNDDTRVQGVLIGGVVYSLHMTDTEVIITDYHDYDIIYQITSIDMWNIME